MSISPLCKWKVARFTGDVVCQHGTSANMHCCNCHSGFTFDHMQHLLSCVDHLVRDCAACISQGRG